MRHVKSRTRLALGAVLLALAAPLAFGQTARLQVVHNASDPSLPAVDVFVNGLRVSNDLIYRKATPFLEIPAGASVDVGIATNVSSNAADTLKNVRLNPTADENYIVFVSGVRADGFRPNPDGEDIGLRLVVKQGARRVAAKPNTVDLTFVHGVTDAPGIDFRELGFGSLPIFAGSGYGDVTSYTTINPVDFNVVLTQTTLSAVILRAFRLELNDRAGQAASLVASGFISPEANCAQFTGCPSLGVIAVFGNGDVVELPVVEESQFISKIQFIHAAGDRDLSLIDVYLNGQRLFDDFPFNFALPFLSVFTGEPLDLGVALSASGSAADTLQNFPLRLDKSDNYTVALVGVLSPFLFAQNPDGRDIGLQLAIAGEGRTSVSTPTKSEFRVLHAITDAPALDLRIRGGEPLMEGLKFGDISGYNSVDALNYKVDVSLSDAPVMILAPYLANFRNFGKPVTFILTGFVDKFRNRLGLRVQLKAVYSDGFVAEWSTEPISDQTARLQFVHAAPDPNLAVVDVYFQDELVYNDLAFQNGQGFNWLLADSLFDVGIAPPASTGPEDVVFSYPVRLDRGRRYTAALVGVTDPVFFAENPDGADISLDLILKDGAREDRPADPTKTEFRVVYAIPDAPKADIYIDNVAVVADTAAFGTITDYVAVDSEGSSFEGQEGYNLNFQPRGDIVFGRSILQMANVGWRSVTIVTTGFLDVFDNQGGPSFRSFMVYTDGFEAPFIENSLTDTEDDGPMAPGAFRLEGAYPNPFQNAARIAFDLGEPAAVDVEVYDVTGRRRIMLREPMLPASKGAFVELDGSELPPGLYLYRITARTASKSHSAAGKLLKLR